MILNFTFRAQYYKVNERGHIKANGLKHYSKDWIFLGGSSHHKHNRITVSLKESFKNPSKLNKCYGWDRDHGTTRQWRGSWYYKIPRIHNVYVTK